MSEPARTERTGALDQMYTTQDHEIRNEDVYAAQKYLVTTKWLRQALTPSIKSSQRLINIGCGTGYFNYSAIDLGFKVLACEPDPMAYSVARNNCPQVGVELRNCGLEALDAKRDSCDAIVMHDVLEHIEDDQQAIDKILSLLRPGGVAILTIPAMSSLFGYHDRQLGHFRRYDKARIRRLVAGKFQIRRMRYFGMMMIPVVLWYSVIRRRPYPVQQAYRGPLRRFVEWVCSVEARIPGPFGVSLFVELVVPQGPTQSEHEKS